MLGTYAGTVRLVDTRAQSASGADQGRRPPRGGGSHTLTNLGWDADTVTWTVTRVSPAGRARGDPREAKG